jgi:chromate transporter
MGAFSLFLSNYKNSGINDGIFKFIQPMAIAFLAFAAIKGFSLSVKNTITQIIMMVSLIFTFVFFKSPWILPILIICGGIATNFSDKRIPDNPNTTSPKIKWTNIVLFLIIFGLAGILSETARKQQWDNRREFNLFENFYRFGSIVFGGGDVLFPMMLDQYVARPTNQKLIERNPNAIKISKEDLLIGYGIVRAIPGPVFSYASFSGGMAFEKEGKKRQFIGCIIGTIAIFLPSALLVFFFFPVWQHLKKYVLVYRALEGINAVVVGFLWAATAYLLKGINLYACNTDTLLSLLIMIISFSLLKFTKFPTPFIVMICLFLGWIF